MSDDNNSNKLFINNESALMPPFLMKYLKPITSFKYIILKNKDVLTPYFSVLPIEAWKLRKKAMIKLK